MALPPQMISADHQFSDRLAVDGERCRPLGAAWGLIAALFLLCLAPRLLMAWKLDAACDDAYYYVFVANCLKKGDFVSAFDYLNLNVYPAILLGLHKLGFDWIIGGKLWGAVIASLTVLPLFGWVRRLFDDRVAAMAGFLYAVHPNLIEVSVEPIREATFWFLLTLSMYLIWRSVDELRIQFFVMAGVAVALALHTRIEGWALFLPLVLWAWHRWRTIENRAGRLRLVFGSLALGAVTPLLIVLVNTTMLRDHGQWEYGRLNHFAVVESWMQWGGLQEPKPEPAEKPAHRLNKQPAKPEPAPVAPVVAVAHTDVLEIPKPIVTTAEIAKPMSAPASPALWPWMYVKDIVRAIGPISLIFFFIGMWNWRHLARHRDKSVLLIVGLGMMLAIWVRLTQIGNLNGRYFLTLPFLFAPWHALGCFDVLRALGKLVDAGIAGDAMRRRVGVGVLSLVLIVGWADALKSHHKERQAHVNFGRYLQEHAAAANAVVADLGSTRAGYFVNGSLPTIIAPDELLDDIFDLHPPDVIVFSRDCLSADREPIVVQRATNLGLKVVDDPALPRTETEFIVMMRMPPAKPVDSPPPQTAARNPLDRR